MDRITNWTRAYGCNPVAIAMADNSYVESKKMDSSENMKARAIYELFLSNLCFLVYSLDGFCDKQEEDEYVRKCNFAQKSLYAEFDFIFKEQKETGYEALVSTKIFSEICDRVTMDHTYSQKMKLNELARMVFRSNIGFQKFKKELLEASKVCLVHKEENLGALSQIQKKLAEGEIEDLDPREIYEMGGVEVVNVYSEDEVVGIFEKLAEQGITKNQAKENFIKNFSSQNKSTNFSKVPKKIKKEIIELVERI